MMVSEENEEEPHKGIPYIVREVYFDHSGFIWEISVRSKEHVTKADMAGSEHIIKTFQILDQLLLLSTQARSSPVSGSTEPRSTQP